MTDDCGQDYKGSLPDDSEEELDALYSVEELRETASRTTDSANADAFVELHGKGYLYCIDWQSWLSWDGKRWQRAGARERVVNAAMLTARSAFARGIGAVRTLEERIRVAALSGQRDEDAENELKREKTLLRWHETSQNMPRLNACVEALQTRLVVRLSELDVDPWLLNVRNGTIDLRTAELRPHEREDRLTQLADIEWSDDATCPTWDAFVHGAMGGDLALVLYLQRLVGYAMTGLTTEHILAFFHGGGQNGKSTFVGTVRSLLGEYACAAPRDLLFEEKKGGKAHPTELARLYAKRFVACSEIGEHETMDEAKVKDLTGGDAVAVRRMREDFWDLIPTHTLFLSGNHKPVVRGADLGIWRRIRLIPWLVEVTPDKVDKNLPEKLRREASGILRWCVQGCLEWQRIGLVEPESVTAATKEYREESDTLGGFLQSYAVFDKESKCVRSTLRKRYEEWCQEVGHQPVGARRLAARLREHGVTGCKVREHGSVKDGWRGVGLKSVMDLIRESGTDTLLS